jgi:hypothetical protein
MSWRGRLTTERWLYLVTVARYAGYFASLYCAAALFRMNVIDWNVCYILSYIVPFEDPVQLCRCEKHGMD